MNPQVTLNPNKHKFGIIIINKPLKVLKPKKNFNCFSYFIMATLIKKYI